MDIIINEGVTKMKTLKARHKLIPAIVMLIVAAITMSTASYAWFTMSTRAEVEGIELTVIAPENLLIRTAEVGGLGKIGTWTNSVNFDTENYYDKVTQVSGVLTHASSANGVDMFTVQNTQEIVYDGSLVSGAAIVVADEFAYNEEDYSYIDYYIEIVNTGAIGGSNLEVGLTDLVITPNDELDPTNVALVEAVRVALLEVDGANLISKGIYSDSEQTLSVYNAATYNSLSSITTADSYDNALSSFAGNTLVELEGIGRAPVAGAAEAGATTLVIRIWVEGEHANAVTENAGKGFSISFALVVD